MNSDSKKILHELGKRKACLDHLNSSDLKRHYSERNFLYLDFGEFARSEAAECSKKHLKDVVGEMSEFLMKHFSGLKGISGKNIMKMVRFYDFCGKNPDLKKLCLKIPWSHICVIISMSHTIGECKKYLKFCVKSGYSKRKMIRVIRGDGPVNDFFENMDDGFRDLPDDGCKGPEIFFDVPDDPDERKMFPEMVIDRIREFEKRNSLSGTFRISFGKRYLND